MDYQEYLSWTRGLEAYHERIFSSYKGRSNEDLRIVIEENARRPGVLDFFAYFLDTERMIKTDTARSILDRREGLEDSVQ
tara:strand:- start:378 stop:617 length:240 start_codon:yes stop_codon:yes gene_type:complete